MASRAVTGVFSFVAMTTIALGTSAKLLAQDLPPKIDDKAKASAVAKDRSNYMTMLGDNEKVLVAVMRGQAPLDAKAVAAAEKINASTDAKEILAHFNPGTGDDSVEGSRARAVLWKEWDKFKELAAAVKPAAAAALDAAKSGDQKVFAEKELASTNACSACHKLYRAPRQR